MLDVLGLDPDDPAWPSSGGGDAKLTSAVDALVAGLLEQRAEARAAKDFAAADAIRDQIKAAGIEIEDTPDGPKWSLSLMPGNSQRKGAINKTGKNPTAGSGGRVKRGLEGKGPTPKAKDRPYHQAHKAAKKKAGEVRRGAPEAAQHRRRRVDRRPQLRGRGAARGRAGHRACTSPRAPSATAGCARRSGSRPSAASACSRCQAASSTG